MTLPIDLDEYPETKLLAELERRKIMRTNNLCDYCGRPKNTSSCEFPTRHITRRSTMTVKELMERLSCYHENAEVWMNSQEASGQINKLKDIQQAPDMLYFSDESPEPLRDIILYDY